MKGKKTRNKDENSSLKTGSDFKHVQLKNLSYKKKFKLQEENDKSIETQTSALQHMKSEIIPRLKIDRSKVKFEPHNQSIESRSQITDNTVRWHSNMSPMGTLKLNTSAEILSLSDFKRVERNCIDAES